MKTVAFVCAALTATASTTAFADDYEMTLQGQVRAGNWSAADNTLRNAAETCRSAATADKCMDKVTFSRAWTYTQHAAQAGAEGQAYLARARTGYEQVLTNNPGNLPTIDNLVLVLQQLGDVDGMLRVLAQLKNLEQPQRAARLALYIGDIYRQRKDDRNAFLYYTQSYGISADPLAVDRMTAVFGQAPTEAAAARLLSYAQKASDVSVQRQLYEAILHARPQVSASDWEAAAIDWVASLGHERQFNAGLIDADAGLKAFPEFAALRDQLRAPSLGLKGSELEINESTLHMMRSSPGWWHQMLLRSWAFTIAAWSEGHNRLLRGDIKGANSIWLAALHLAPPIDSYRSNELNKRWYISLDLLTDVARLQKLYQQQLDPDNRTFRGVERLLFESKGDAYAANDLEAIQRHHTLMGKLYADLGDFSQSEHGMKSAEFQLQNAILTAERRSQQTGTPDPQPALAKLLADGYDCRLPKQNTSCQKNISKAQTYYESAAKDFLKLEAVQPARTSLQYLKTIQPNPTAATKELETMIESRSRIDAGSQQLRQSTQPNR